MRLMIAVVLLAAAALAPARAEVSLAGVQGYDDCDALATRHPDSYEAHRCYWMLSRRGAGFEEAERRLRGRLAVEPGNTLARFMLGKVLQDSGERERAEPVLREAIAGFVEESHAQGEVHARLSLSSMLALLGRPDESMTELDAAGEAAERSGNRELVQAVISERAWNAYRKHDYGHAYAFFYELHSMLDETSPSYLQGEALSGLGASSWGMQRFADSLRYYREEAALRRKVGDRHAEALARGNVLLLLSIVQNIDLEERLEYLKESLDAARRAENRRAESTVLRLWALADPGDPRGVERLERAASISRELSDVTSLCNVLPELAKRVIDDDPARAFALVDEAIGVARDAANDFALAQASVARGHLRWQTGPRETAIRDSLASLDAIERMRDRQSDSSSRAVHFQRWFGAYYELAARLLRPDGRAATPEEQELAFQIVERMRTRQLIERLDRAAGHRVPDAPEAVLSEREGVLEQISEVQNRLMRGLRGAERTEALAALEDLEHRENVLRAEIARADPEFGALRRPTLPTLEQLRSAIAEDQALLSFQLADDLPISLLVVHTSRATRSYPVPTLDALNSAVRLYRGLLERRDDSARESGASLFANLLEQPLAELPDSVRRLVIVPDGPLQQLPFDTLTLTGSRDTMVSRYDLSLTPSISAWLRFREKNPAGSARSVLALADPVHPAHRGGRNAGIHLRRATGPPALRPQGGRRGGPATGAARPRRDRRERHRGAGQERRPA